jgi:predicted AAA+ superfamily ATPase
MKDEMIAVPDIGNTQAYSDDESSKAEKIAERMHNFIVNETVLKLKGSAPGIKCKTKYSREIEENAEDNEFQFSDDEWVLEDNSQQLTSMKRNKKDDHDKDPDGMGSARNSSVTEISVSTFANLNKSKASQKDKQPSNDNNNKKKKGNIITINIINIMRLLICYSMILAL